MAILGAQAVVTLVMISFLQKICPLYSFGRWLLTKRDIIRFLHPTDDELRQLSGANKQNNGKKSRKIDNTIKENTFNIPRSLEITLSSAPVTNIDVIPLRFFPDFIWLMDFAISTSAVVLLTYMHEHYLSPHSNEYGLSSVWCCLMVMFSIKPLVSIVTSYKIEQNSGEIVLCCLFGFFLLITAMVILLVDDQFNGSAMEFLSRRGIKSSAPMSLVTYKAFLALVSGFIGGLLTFPGIRLARCHMDALLISRERPILQALMYLDILFPVFLMTLWVPPISRKVLVGQPIPGTSAVMSDEHFETIKSILLITFILSRIFLLKYRLQAYLNTACNRVDSLRKEAGKITNVDLQATVTQVFYYLCVVTLQLVAPLTLLTAAFLMAKSFTSSAESNVEPISTTPASDIEDVLQSMKAQVQEFTVTLAELRAVFSSYLFQSMTSYFIWFILFSWTSTTFFGLFYHSYMLKS